MKNVYLIVMSIAFLTGTVPVWAQSPTAPAATITPVIMAPEKQVDALLAKWSGPDTPGCAIAVIQDKKVIYRRGVGMADLEHDAAITPTTVFHVSSMSKQFTAFAIHLLAKDGKLALDDDIRKYLPELHDFGSTITIRHLLHHTSGLRDQWHLLILAGWRMEDVITEDDIFRLIQRQRGLDFVPGEKFSYSNTGYTLLGMIVKRVSGQSLPVFAQERIFAPLGMTHTQFRDDYSALIKGSAFSYEKDPNGIYKHIGLSYSNVGATSLLTTVNDLALWDQNFYDGQLGGKKLLGQMQTQGELGNGKPINYASGLFIGEYRGQKTVSHTGSDAGYRSEFLRFPGQHFSVIVLGNAADINPVKTARRIADIYLAKELAPMPIAKTKQTLAMSKVAIEPALKQTWSSDAEPKAFEGEFYSDELHVLYNVITKNGVLILSHPRGDFILDFVAPAQFLTRSIGPNHFLVDGLGPITYKCSAGEGCSGFTINDNIYFAKVTLSPTGTGANNK